MDTITLPATLSGTLNLADINHRLRTDEVKLDWSKVQTFRPDQLSELLTDLDLVELPPEHDDGPMAGILLYTAAPDSEGTLGGLVGLGTPELFGTHIDHALEQMHSCTSDPLVRRTQLPARSVPARSRLSRLPLLARNIVRTRQQVPGQVNSCLDSGQSRVDVLHAESIKLIALLSTQLTLRFVSDW